VAPQSTTTLAERVREIYAGLGASDPERTLRACWPDVVVEVAGTHLLSGTYVGVPAVRALFARIQELGGRAAFTITGLMSDEAEDQVLVEACWAQGRHVRTVVHRLVLREGRLAELHEHPMDQAAENEFWRRRSGG
jgi:ketosteroid isomerase-like protein